MSDLLLCTHSRTFPRLVRMGLIPVERYIELFRRHTGSFPPFFEIKEEDDLEVYGWFCKANLDFRTLILKKDIIKKLAANHGTQYPADFWFQSYGMVASLLETPIGTQINSKFVANYSSYATFDADNRLIRIDYDKIADYGDMSIAPYRAPMEEAIWADPSTRGFEYLLRSDPDFWQRILARESYPGTGRMGIDFRRLRDVVLGRSSKGLDYRHLNFVLSAIAPYVELPLMEYTSSEPSRTTHVQVAKIVKPTSLITITFDEGMAWVDVPKGFNIVITHPPDLSLEAQKQIIAHGVMARVHFAVDEPSSILVPGLQASFYGLNWWRYESAPESMGLEPGTQIRRLKSGLDGPDLYCLITRITMPKRPHSKELLFEIKEKYGLEPLKKNLNMALYPPDVIREVFLA